MASNHASHNSTDRPKREPRKTAGDKPYSGPRRVDATPSQSDLNGAWTPSPSPRVAADDKRALGDDGWVKAYHAERDRARDSDPEIGG